MVLTGIDVWFDEWEIPTGDSIPGKLDEGLEAFDGFVLLWSADADRSNWVCQELRPRTAPAISANPRKPPRKNKSRFLGLHVVGWRV
jgi:TIR domain